MRASSKSKQPVWRQLSFLLSVLTVIALVSIAVYQTERASNFAELIQKAPATSSKQPIKIASCVSPSTGYCGDAKSATYLSLPDQQRAEAAGRYTSILTTSIRFVPSAKYLNETLGFLKTKLNFYVLEQGAVKTKSIDLSYAESILFGKKIDYYDDQGRLYAYPADDSSEMTYRFSFSSTPAVTQDVYGLPLGVMYQKLPELKMFGRTYVIDALHSSKDTVYAYDGIGIPLYKNRPIKLPLLSYRIGVTNVKSADALTNVGTIKLISDYGTGVMDVGPFTALNLEPHVYYFFENFNPDCLSKQVPCTYVHEGDFPRKFQVNDLVRDAPEYMFNTPIGNITRIKTSACLPGMTCLDQIDVTRDLTPFWYAKGGRTGTLTDSNPPVNPPYFDFTIDSRKAWNLRFTPGMAANYTNLRFNKTAWYEPTFGNLRILLGASWADRSGEAIQTLAATGDQLGGFDQYVALAKDASSPVTFKFKGTTVINDKVVSFDGYVGSLQESKKMIFHISGREVNPSVTYDANKDVWKGTLVFNSYFNPIKCSFTYWENNSGSVSVAFLRIDNKGDSMKVGQDLKTSSCDLYPNVVPVGMGTKQLGGPKEPILNNKGKNPWIDLRNAYFVGKLSNERRTIDVPKIIVHESSEYSYTNQLTVRPYSQNDEHLEVYRDGNRIVSAVAMPPVIMLITPAGSFAVVPKQGSLSLYVADSAARVKAVLEPF